MLVQSLSLYNFRNLADCSLNFSPSFNFFLGKNGQGKTNILEAIHLLSLSKSFRTTKFGELCAWERSEFSIIGEIEHQEYSQKLAVVWQDGDKSFFINETKSSILEFVGNILSVTFTPNDSELIRGAPAVRRQFLDKHAVDYDKSTLQYLLRFNAALKNKNAVLKAGGSDDELDAWDGILSENGVQLVQRRRLLIEELQPFLSEIYLTFAPEEGVELMYKPSIPHTDSGQFFDGVVKYRSEERAFRSSLHGPQRDDFYVGLKGQSAKSFASQGQAKSLALALKLAMLSLLEERLQKKPVVLLDDIDSELDPVRQRLMYEYIFHSTRQVFITGTTAHPWMLSDITNIRHFEVNGGQVSLQGAML